MRVDSTTPWLPVLIVVMLSPFAALSLPAAEREELRPIDLVGSDAAVVCEVFQPKAGWEAFRQSELFRRFEESPFHEELLGSPGFRQWQNVEDAVAGATGRSLSSQLLDLFSREVVLAAYLPPQNQPQGVLIARAEQPAAVDRFLQTWKTVEPNVAAQPLKHRGETYYLRPASAGRKANLFYVTFGPVFAVSDHESRIHQVIELQQTEAASERIGSQAAYRRAISESREETSTARIVLLARAWERVWQDASQNDPGAALLQRLWPAFDSLSLDLRTTDGLHAELRGLLHPAQTDDRWKKWSEPTPDPRAFLKQVPADAVLVAAGGIHAKPLWQFVQELATESDRENWTKGRRLLRGILGGRDLLDDVLPALTHNVGLYLAPLADGKELVPFDGVLTVQFPPGERSAGLQTALDQALSSALTLLTLQSAEKFPDSEPATIQADFSGDTITRWLKTPQPFRVAYQITPSTLRVSRSVERLRNSAKESAANGSSTFAAASDRWFPEADQFVCLDVRKWRASSKRSVRSNDSPGRRFQSLLALGDAVYFAARFDASKLTVRVGVAVEADR